MVGEVGRGTFVRAAERPSPGGPALAEPADAQIDLELNYPVVAEQSVLPAAALERLRRPDVLEAALRPVGVAGTAAAREAAAAFVVGTGAAPRAVRFGLASPPPDVLARALGTLAEIARGTPDDSPVD